jgi:hypothetical protein
MSDAQQSPPTKNWHPMMERSARLLRERTGAGVEEWNERVRKESGAADEDGLRVWLDGQGVGGYPQMLLVMERFGYPDYLTASAEELIDGQYADRPNLRPVTDRLLAAARALGADVQARKTYVSLVGPRRTFAIVQASTKKRVDLGLRLDGQAPEGRLLEAKSLGNDNIRLRIPFTEPDEVDDEALDWLRRTYEANL